MEKESTTKWPQSENEPLVFTKRDHTYAKGFTLTIPPSVLQLPEVQKAHEWQEKGFLVGSTYWFYDYVRPIKNDDKLEIFDIEKDDAGLLVSYRDQACIDVQYDNNCIDGYKTDMRNASRFMALIPASAGLSALFGYIGAMPITEAEQTKNAQKAEDSCKPHTSLNHTIVADGHLDGKLNALANGEIQSVTQQDYKTAVEECVRDNTEHYNNSTTPAEAASLALAVGAGVLMALSKKHFANFRQCTQNIQDLQIGAAQKIGNIEVIDRILENKNPKDVVTVPPPEIFHSIEPSNHM